MSQSTRASKLHLPKFWSSRVRSALVHVMALAPYAAVHTRNWAADSRNVRLRLQATNEQLRQEIAFLRAEMQIKDARMACLLACLPAQRRPH